MDNLPLIIGVVVVAAVLAYLLFFRKKALPETTTAPKKGASAPPPSAKPESVKAKAAEPESVKAPSTKAKAPAGAEEDAVTTPVTPAPTPEAPAAAAPTAEAPPVVSKKDVAGLRKGLAATRGGFMAKLKALFTGKKEIDPAILDQIEEIMITSDVGVKTTQTILERLRDALAKNELSDSDAVWRSAVRALSISMEKESTLA